MNEDREALARKMASAVMGIGGEEVEVADLRDGYFIDVVLSDGTEAILEVHPA